VSVSRYENGHSISRTTELACIAVEHLYLQAVDAHKDHPRAAYYRKKHFNELLEGKGLKQVQYACFTYSP